MVATACAEYTAVFTNAIMPSLVPQKELGRLSGAGWACGYFGGLASLFLVAGLIVPVGDTGKTLLGLDPLFALDTASREGDRIVGPLSAVWYLVFMIPFFLFVPDVRQKRAHDGRHADGGAVGHGAFAAGEPRHAALPHRAHDLHRRPHRHLHVRRHLRRLGVRLGSRWSSACSASS